MDLSVIIVNYNVRYFLEQCLYSVFRAADGLSLEVIVTDNNSTDGSVAYLAKRFPEVKFIVNNHNAGFSRACNQGLAIATGAYVLFLNPDTILGEDTLHAALDYLKANVHTGALGVRMIDGTGSFLKESKRSFPSPFTALYKLFGLSQVFPRSKLFGKYHLGHLSEHENHEVDVLAGAFMLLPRAVLQSVGSFDEAFFMYGEDIDLSYRVQQAGFANAYFAGTTIIHFKGESTKRGSLNYVRMFYSAMNIFVRKHYGGARAGFFRGSIQVAVWVRAALAALAKALRWVGLPLIDAALILLSFWLVKEFWVHYVRRDIVYPEKLLRISFPVYTIAYLATAYYAGLYDRIYRRPRLLRATIVSLLVLLAIYALLPESWRFSRGILLFGSLLGMLLIGTVRQLLLSAGVLQQPLETTQHPFLLVASGAHEYPAIVQFLEAHNRHTKLIGRIGLPGETGQVVGTTENIEAAVAQLNAEELVFCAGVIPYREIIMHTGRLKGKLRLRFHAAGSGSMVGSDSSGSAGETLSPTAPMNLEEPAYRRAKRFVDLSVSLLFIGTLPVHLLFIKHPLQFARNCFDVLLGRMSWIGYLSPFHTPPLRPGVLAANGVTVAEAKALPEENRLLIDQWYARDYEPVQDLTLIVKNYRRLGS